MLQVFGKEMGELITNKFPDGNFSRSRLAVFALASPNKNIAAAFNSRTQSTKVLCSSPQNAKTAQGADCVSCGHSHTPLELFDVLTNSVELLQTWNAEMTEFLRQERKDQVLNVTL